MNLTIKTSVGNIILRPMSIKDISYQLDYLYNSPKDFLERIGFDTSKLPGRELHEVGIKKRLKERSKKPQSVVAELHDGVIAIVNLQLVEEPKAHFHILQDSLRGKNLGKPILTNALKILMNEHSLKELLIEPKIDNSAMNKLLKKCQFEYLGETTFSGTATYDFKASSYRVSLESLN